MRETAPRCCAIPNIVHEHHLTLEPIIELLAIMGSHPRWLPFLRKIGKAPDQLAKIEFKVPPLPQ